MSDFLVWCVFGWESVVFPDEISFYLHFRNILGPQQICVTKDSSPHLEQKFMQDNNNNNNNVIRHTV